MPTVAHLVHKYIRSLPHLEQFIERDLVSFHRLARYLQPQIETELGKANVTNRPSQEGMIQAKIIGE